MMGRISEVYHSLQAVVKQKYGKSAAAVGDEGVAFFGWFLSHQPQPSLSIQMIGPWLRWICTKHPGRVGFPMGGWQLNQLTSSVLHCGFPCLKEIYCRGHRQSFHHYPPKENDEGLQALVDAIKDAGAAGKAATGVIF